MAKIESQGEKDVIVLLDEGGEPARFAHVLTFFYEGARYVALVPEEEADDDEAEVVLLRIEEKDGGDVYVSIDNEVLLDEVFNEFLDLMDELEGGESGREGE
ncbi:MAG TPA: DUF1292 domain-containing protein [Clostridia bacterium]|nr:MAG: hypothetical protein BWY35_01015 [Firmicutes bacterium ADurb.Bin248]HOG00836.1 DUF1292 domain-containing protein [Clostridia bacterium]HOS18108.1 DUF1292 domain-containing protein [Clostridia bacterium]HPK14741.1 DUF1292 domain-containing protein [Clostridia bacterium]